MDVLQVESRRPVRGPRQRDRPGGHGAQGGRTQRSRPSGAGLADRKAAPPASWEYSTGWVRTPTPRGSPSSIVAMAVKPADGQQQGTSFDFLEDPAARLRRPHRRRGALDYQEQTPQVANDFATAQVGQVLARTASPSYWRRAPKRTAPLTVRAEGCPADDQTRPSRCRNLGRVLKVTAAHSQRRRPGRTSARQPMPSCRWSLLSRGAPGRPAMNSTCQSASSFVGHRRRPAVRRLCRPDPRVRNHQGNPRRWTTSIWSSWIHRFITTRS